MAISGTVKKKDVILKTQPDPPSNFMVSYRIVVRFFLFERYVLKRLFLLLLVENGQDLVKLHSLK